MRLAERVWRAPFSLAMIKPMRAYASRATGELLAAGMALTLCACDPEVSAVLPPLDGPLAGSDYARTVQRTPGLLAYFRFSEPSGTTAVDRVKGYRLQAEAGAVLAATGALTGDPEEGGVLIAGNEASRLTMQFPAAFEKLSSALSLELWLKLRGQGTTCAQPSQPLAKLLWVEGVIG